MEDDDYSWKYSDEYQNPKPCDHSSEKPLLHTYEITYVKPNGVTVTELIEADEVFTECDLVEFWLNDVALLIVSSTAVQQVRNVSALDMRLL